MGNVQNPTASVNLTIYYVDGTKSQSTMRSDGSSRILQRRPSEAGMSDAEVARYRYLKEEARRLEDGKGFLEAEITELETHNQILREEIAYSERMTIAEEMVERSKKRLRR
jgi:hypothetical protein